VGSVTLKDVAEKVGVSQRLVAYALNGNGRVGPVTRERIIEEARRLGYRPNRAARTLVTGRSQLLALCLPKLATAYGDAVTRIMESMARPSEYDLMVTRMGDGGNSAHPTSLLPRGLVQVDGAFLLQPPRLPMAPELSVIKRAVVMGVGYGQAFDSMDYVRVDLAAAARAAVSALLKSRPRRFAYMTTIGFGPAPGEVRWDAYVAGAKLIGQRPICITLARDTDLSSDARNALLHYVKSNKCPDAIMCSNDEIAIGVLRALRELDIIVPRDVVLTGCDGIDYAQDVCPPLSTIAQPFAKMLEISWGFMMRRLEAPDEPPQHAVIDAQFIARQSSDGKIIR